MLPRRETSAPHGFANEAGNPGPPLAALSSTNTIQNAVYDVLSYIGMNRPQQTSEGIPPTPTMKQRTHDSLIDPDLERIIPAFSAINQPAPIQPPLASATICDPINTVQTKHQPLPSLAPTLLRVEPVSQPREIPQPPSTSPALSSTLLGTQAAPAQSFATKLSTQASASPVRPRIIVDINFVVIYSQTPVYRYKTWQPKGFFLEKSLSELLSELPLNNNEDIKSLTIRLFGRGVDVRETLDRGADSKYEVTKSRFLQIVKMCLRNWNETYKGQPFAMGVDIEANWA